MAICTIPTDFLFNESIQTIEKRRKARRERIPVKATNVRETLRDKKGPARLIGGIFACSPVTGLFRLKIGKVRCLSNSNSKSNHVSIL